MRYAMVMMASVVTLSGCMPQGQKPNNTSFAGLRREPPAVPMAHAVPIDAKLREAARAQIAEIAGASDPLLRAHALEALRQTGGTEGNPEILRGLSDPEAVVRFAAAMAAGELRVVDAGPSLLKLVNDSDKAVQVGVRFALHRLGDKRFSHDLEKLARDPDVSVRGDTAMALGLIGEPSAIQVLRAMQFDKDATVRLQAQEAMWRMGDTSAREELVAATFSHYADDQAIAYLALAEPRDPQMLPHVRGGLVSDFPQIQLIAARAAGMLGSDMGYSIAMRAVKDHDPVLRALAGFALGAIGRSDAQPALAELLKDPDADCRLAAATAILKLQDGK